MASHEEEKVKIEELETSVRLKIWQFLNSSIGLWLLSTVFIGAFTFFFNEYIQMRSDEKERITRINDLDIEIESRISQFWVNMESVTSRKDDTSFVYLEGVNPDTVKIFWEAFKHAPIYHVDMMFSVFPQFEKRNITSLLIELSTLIDEGHGVGEHDIESVAIFIAGSGVHIHDEALDMMSMWRIFKSKIILLRWSKEFAYTDCGEIPFC